MYSPFFLDLPPRADFDMPGLEERRVPRRSGPQRLRLEPVPPGAPFLYVSLRHLPPPTRERRERGSWLARLWRGQVAAPAM